MFDRITRDPEILGGKPIIRGMRLSVEHVLEVLAGEGSFAAVRAAYPELEEEDLRQVLLFAATVVGDEIAVRLPA